MKISALLLALALTGCAATEKGNDFWGPLMFGVTVLTGGLEVINHGLDIAAARRASIQAPVPTPSAPMNCVIKPPMTTSTGQTMIGSNYQVQCQ